jgi:RND family efflux transporter MFP subunit
VVTARNYDAGDMYSGGMPLYTVQQIRPVKIKVNAPEGLYGKIKKGQSVSVKLDVFGDEVFEGKVHLVYPSLAAASRTFPVEITIANANERVRPGMFARVTFKYGVEHNIVVPDVSVVKQMGSGDHYVYTVVDNKVVFNKVKLGQLVGTEYEIKSGLNEGDMVIVEGQNRVVNGQEVNSTVGEPASFVPDNLVDKTK